MARRPVLETVTSVSVRFGMAEVFAGAATADITPGVGVRMGGYGARVGVSQAVRDPLLVRALVLSDGENEIAIAVCDLLGVSAGLAAEARRIVAEEVGIPPAHVVVAATHTHSGPGTLTSRDGPEYVATTARKVAGAVSMAKRAMTPVVLKLGTAEVASISQNRRDPSGPIERVARVLLAAAPAPAAPVATLVNYACHSTVFEHDNLEYSPDFPGAMARAVEAAVGGTAVYLQGAAGDINPVWMRHDPVEVERVGGILAAAATRVVHELRPAGEGQWCANLSWSEAVAVPAEPGVVLDGVSLRGVSATLELERRPLRPVEDIDAELADLEARIGAVPPGDVASRRRLIARRNELDIDRAYTVGGAHRRPAQRVEVQALRLSPTCALVALPGEFFVEIGDEIRRRSPFPEVLVAGYANGMIGYVPTEEAFAHGGYEVGSARFHPDAAAIITTTALELLASLA